MLFSTLPFFLFLPIVFVLYWFVFNKKLNLQNALLLVASYVFYGWWSWTFCGLLMLSTLIDYSFGFLVASPSKQRARLFLWLSILNNLGILFVFKYYNFFALEFKQGMALLGLPCNPVLLSWALPVGISFYTFHGMSYVFDIYQRKQKPVRELVDYAVFVSFFPLLVAGPIERASHLLPQIQKKRFFNYTQAVEGCRLILWGLFKKIIIADSIAPIISSFFEQPENETAYALLLGAIGFSIQIYGDFSGYSDMALGTAKLFGIELLSNFRFPYLSRNIAEFWRRWHISLSSWFRDYLYIPLGGSREGRFKAIRNTFAIFLVSGFWHGASWNFIVWGLLHALAFIPSLLLNKHKRYATGVVAANQRFPSFTETMQMGFTFMVVSIAFVFFRIPDWHKALFYFVHLVSDAFHHPSQFLHFPAARTVADSKLIWIPLLALMSFVGDWYLRHNERVLRVPKNTFVRKGVYFILFTACLLKLTSSAILVNPVQFIYFQF
jgi:D-alanyl-lipoteichoic acid acyltransferase DltB (MBOAT superfamily)